MIKKNYKEIQESKLAYEIGRLYNHLNVIEKQGNLSIKGSDIIKFYNLKTGSKTPNRCACPLHGGNNTSSLQFNDVNHSFVCHACGQSGTYIEFISKLNKISLNESKIIIATKFCSLDLGFISLEDYKDKVRTEILKYYNKTKSLNPLDYYHISILPDEARKYPYNNTKTVACTKVDKSVDENIKHPASHFKLESLDIFKVVREIDSKTILDNGATNYQKAITTALNSQLIRDLFNHKLNDKSSLENFMLKKYNLTPEDYNKFGLIFFPKSNEKMLKADNFNWINDRVLFPFKDDETGMIVGYQCRNTDLNAGKKYKYLNVAGYGEMNTSNSGYTYRGLIPLTISNFLFNLYELKNKDVKSLWITEGVADCICLSSINYNSVSPGQSNLTDHQIALIQKYFGTDVEINLFFDADGNNVGQNNSIKIAYKLWQYNFKNINIIRTYKELGKDLTDCSVKINNKNVLKTLVDTWYKESYKFKPTPDEVLNKLISSGLYTLEELLMIDPREIDNHVVFIETVAKHIDLSNVDLDILKSIKGFKNLEPAAIEIQLHKIAETLKPDIKPTANELKFINLSERQLYVLKQIFQMDIILRIDTECNKNQINAIMGKIKKNEPFNIDDYLRRAPYSTSKSNTIKEFIPYGFKVTDNGDFTSAKDVEDMPF